MFCNKLTHIIRGYLKLGFGLLLLLVSNVSYAAIAYTTDAQFLTPLPSFPSTTPINNNVVGTAVTDTSISTMGWGVPVPPSLPSLLTFEGVHKNTALPSDGTLFTVGFMSFFNGVTDGNEVGSVDLMLNAWQCDQDAGRCDSGNFNLEKHSTVPIAITIYNTNNVDPDRLAPINSDSFCIDVAVIGQVCAYTREGTSDLLTEATVGAVNYGVFALQASLGSIVIEDIVPLTAGTFTTLGSDPNQNMLRSVPLPLPVPEPSILALFSLGLFGLGFARRRIRS